MSNIAEKTQPEADPFFVLFSASQERLAGLGYWSQSGPGWTTIESAQRFSPEERQDYVHPKNFVKDVAWRLVAKMGCLSAADVANLFAVGEKERKAA